MLAWTKGLANRPWIPLVAALLLEAGLVVACTSMEAEPLAPAPSSQAQVVSSPPVLQEQARPNILLITVDTLRADALGAYGNPSAQTPNMDALARALRALETQGYRPRRWLENMARVDRPQAQAQAASLLLEKVPAYA